MANEGLTIEKRGDGVAIVLAAEPQFEQLASNDLDDASFFHASPVPSRGQLLLRSNRFVYCIGNAQDPK